MWSMGIMNSYTLEVEILLFFVLNIKMEIFRRHFVDQHYKIEQINSLLPKI
jgi:hypothetical protein